MACNDIWYNTILFLYLFKEQRPKLPLKGIINLVEGHCHIKVHISYILQRLFVENTAHTTIHLHHQEDLQMEDEWTNEELENTAKSMTTTSTIQLKPLTHQTNITTAKKADCWVALCHLTHKVALNTPQKRINIFLLHLNE